MLKMRRFNISTAANEAAMDRMWMIWRIGIAQNWLTIHKVSDDSDIASANSLSGVERSHSVKLNNRSPIRLLSSPALTPTRQPFQQAAARQTWMLAQPGDLGPLMTVAGKVTARDTRVYARAV